MEPLSAKAQAEIDRQLWRADVAEQHLGCTPLEAATVAADRNIDVCTARELVRKGCPQDVALQLATREH